MPENQLLIFQADPVAVFRLHVYPAAIVDSVGSVQINRYVVSGQDLRYGSPVIPVIMGEDDRLRLQPVLSYKREDPRRFVTGIDQQAGPAGKGTDARPSVAHDQQEQQQDLYRHST